jgi:dUTPase
MSSSPPDLEAFHWGPRKHPSYVSPLTSLCPRCHRGQYWANECRSKTDNQGRPLLPWHSGNYLRGHPRAPTSKRDPQGNRVYFTADFPSHTQSVAQLCRATKNSPGWDLCDTSSTILTSEEGIQAMPTGIYGPLLPNTFGIVLGRTSLSSEGLQITPDVIDSNHQGEIQILASTTGGPVFIPAQQTIAQLLLFPRVFTTNPYHKDTRAPGKRGITETFWAQKITSSHPVLTLRSNGKTF